jgi:hypothetical protein
MWLTAAVLALTGQCLALAEGSLVPTCHRLGESYRGEPPPRAAREERHDVSDFRYLRGRDQALADHPA